MRRAGSQPTSQSMTPETWRVIGYLRDAAIILLITVAGIYVLEHPEKFDAFLNWMSGRQ
jgi:hypothetical protein